MDVTKDLFENYQDRNGDDTPSIFQTPSEIEPIILEPSMMAPEKRRKISTYDQNQDGATATSNQNSVDEESRYLWIGATNETTTSPKGEFNGFDDDDDDDCDDLEKLPLSDGPIPHPSMDMTESLIAQKMSKLSMEDREAVYYDIHGVADVIDEDSEPGFLDRKINEMDVEIDRIDPKGKAAYEMARTKNQDYVDDRNFRLRFLRADRFNVKAAANRYVGHYQTKLELFGADKLGRNIAQDDLDDETLEALYCGSSQSLPRRDRAGRIVFLWISKKQQSYSTQALFRRVFYVTTNASEDIESQRKGIVFVIYNLQQEQNLRGSQGTSRLQTMAGIIRVLPVAVASIHFCYDNFSWMPVMSVFQVSCHYFTQLRFRTHFGSHAKCMQNLQSFGIPADTIPIDENGNISLEHHSLVLEKRRTYERQRAAQKDGSNTEPIKITIPKTCDILLGRGKGFFNHVGNVRYRSVIEDRKLDYDQESKEGRQRIAEGIVAMVHNYGGRFLNLEDGVWVEIDNKSARKKVSHSFRALRSASHRINNNAPSAKRIQRN